MESREERENKDDGGHGDADNLVRIPFASVTDFMSFCL